MGKGKKVASKWKERLTDYGNEGLRENYNKETLRKTEVGKGRKGCQQRERETDYGTMGMRVGGTRVTGYGNLRLKV